MFPSLDEKLVAYFQPERLADAFYKYEEAKRDFFTTEVKICMGADGISYETFKKELSIRGAFISRRVLNGTYQFYPFRERNVPKSPTKERVLSIATIRDVLVQKILYEAIYDDVEKLFKATYKLDRVSCAYRQGKSAQYAALLVHEYIQKGFQFVLDADIIQFFDKIPHNRLLTLIEELFVQSSLARNLLRRFVKTGGVPYKEYQVKPGKQLAFHHLKPDRQKIARQEGIPQGGVLSGMLANLYLHEFDRWIIGNLSEKYNLRYVRYADDFVILMKDEAAVAPIHKAVSQKMEEIGLQLHTEKTRHLNVTKDNLEFVGFKFTLKEIRIRPNNIERFKNRIREKIEQEPTYCPKLTNPKRRLYCFINNVLNYKIIGRDEEICQTCSGVIGERANSWIGFFSVITETTQLHELDKCIRKEVSAHFYRQYNFRLNRVHFHRVGLKSLEQEYYRIHKRKLCSCAIPNPMSNVSPESA